MANSAFLPSRMKISKVLQTCSQSILFGGFCASIVFMYTIGAFGSYISLFMLSAALCLVMFISYEVIKGNSLPNLGRAITVGCAASLFSFLVSALLVIASLVLSSGEDQIMEFSLYSMFIPFFAVLFTSILNPLDGRVSHYGRALEFMTTSLVSCAMVPYLSIDWVVTPVVSSWIFCCLFFRDSFQRKVTPRHIATPLTMIASICLSLGFGYVSEYGNLPNNDAPLFEQVNYSGVASRIFLPLTLLAAYIFTSSISADNLDETFRRMGIDFSGVSGGGAWLDMVMCLRSSPLSNNLKRNNYNSSSGSNQNMIPGKHFDAVKYRTNQQTNSYCHYLHVNGMIDTNHSTTDIEDEQNRLLNDAFTVDSGFGQSGMRTYRSK